MRILSQVLGLLFTYVFGLVSAVIWLICSPIFLFGKVADRTKKARKEKYMKEIVAPQRVKLQQAHNRENPYEMATKNGKHILLAEHSGDPGHSLQAVKSIMECLKAERKSPLCILITRQSPYLKKSSEKHGLIYHTILLSEGGLSAVLSTLEWIRNLPEFDTREHVLHLQYPVSLGYRQSESAVLMGLNSLFNTLDERNKVYEYLIVIPSHAYEFNTVKSFVSENTGRSIRLMEVTKYEYMNTRSAHYSNIILYPEYHYNEEMMQSPQYMKVAKEVFSEVDPELIRLCFWHYFQVVYKIQDCQGVYFSTDMGD